MKIIAAPEDTSPTAIVLIFNLEDSIISIKDQLAATWAFIDIMESSRLNIRTIAVGEVSSGAAMIFIAGDQRIMTPNSTAMFHHLSTFSGGTYPDLLAARK